MNRKEFIQSLALTAGYAATAAAEPFTLQPELAAAAVAVEEEIPEMPAAPWRGAWLGLDWLTDARAMGLPPVLFRCDVVLNAAPTAGTVRVSASPGYLLWVNGQFVNQGPLRSYPAHQFYDELNLLPYLRPGANSLAVLVPAPTGVTGYSVNARLGFILDGELITPAGPVAVTTDPKTWRSRRATEYAPPLLLASMPTGFQEHWLGPAAEGAWQTAPLDKAWGESLPLGPAWTPPWQELRPRSIPLLLEAAARPPLVWRGSAARALLDWRDNLAVHFNADPVRGRAGQEADYDAFDVQGDNVLTFDFGRTRLLRPGVETLGITGAVRVECYYALELLDRPTTMVGFGSTQEGFVDTFSAPEGEARWTGTTPRGCRFLTLKFSGPGRGRVRLACRTVDYPFAAGATLTSTDELLPAVWSVSAASLRSSANDVYVDTCSRENMAWTLDSCLQGKAGFYTFGETKHWRRSLLLAMQGIDEDGVPHAINPSERSFMVLFDQTMQAVGLCWEYYLATDDRSLLREITPAVGRFVRRCEQHITTENLFVPPAYSWHWIDWAAIDRDPYSLPINCLLLQLAERTQQLAGAVNDQPLAATGARIARRLRPALARFYDASTGCFRARVEPVLKELAVNRFMYYENPVTSNLHGNLLACRLGVGTSAQRQAALACCAAWLAAPITSQNMFGPGWADTLLAPLVAGGYAPQVLRFMDAYYGGYLRAGAPTWGEAYVPETDANKLRFNTAHGWGAVVNSLIVEQFIGLQPLTPGWRAVELNPHWPKATTLAYELLSPVGPIAVVLENQTVAAKLPKGLPLKFRGQAFVGTGVLTKIG